jgi:serine/threonine protein kinase
LLRAHRDPASVLAPSAGSPDEAAPARLAPAGGLDPAADDRAGLEFLGPATKPGSLGRLGHYEVLNVLGRGGFSTVVRAFDEKLQRVVAIKVLSPQLAATSPPRKRFLREARAFAAVHHENVVQIHAVEEKPIPYLVMEHIAGQTLQEKLDATGPLETPEMLRLAVQLAHGLAAAHAKGLIHRDIKPSNILLEAGTGPRVKLIDFGLVRVADDASLTHSGVVAGTPMYMAPEQAQGEAVDQRADLFSLGSVFYVMLSGRPPFRATTMVAVLKRVVEDTPRPIRETIPEVPRWLCDVIAKLHAKKPEDRFQTAKEVADLLERCWVEIKAHGGLASPPAVADRKSVFRSPGWRWVAALAPVLCLAILGVTEVTGLTRLVGGRQPTSGSKDGDSGASKATPELKPEDGFVSLFDGKTLAGWFVESGDEEHFRVKDGVIVVTGRGLRTQNFLLSDKEYMDYRLRFECYLEDGALTAVNVRAARGETSGQPGGWRLPVHPAINLTDPMHGPPGTTFCMVRGPDFIPPKEKIPLPLRRWNQVEVEVIGRTCRAWFNGELVVDVNLSDSGRVPFLPPALGRPRGHVGFVSNQGTARFRNIAIKELSRTVIPEPGVGFVDSRAYLPLSEGGRRPVIDFAEIHGASPEAVVRWANSLDPGFIPFTLGSHASAKPSQVHAIAVKLAGLPLEWEVWYGPRNDDRLPPVKFEKAGYRALQIHYCFDRDQDVHHLRVWVRDPLPRAYWAHPNRTLDGHMAEHRKQGFKPDLFLPCQRPNPAAFNIHWMADSGRNKWRAEADLQREQLSRFSDEARANDLFVSLITGYQDEKGNTRFGMVAWENPAGLDWAFKLDLTTAEYETELSRRKKDGLRPVAVTSYGDVANPRYAASWVRYSARK